MAELFIKKVKDLEFEINNHQIASIEAQKRIQKNFDFSNYEIYWVGNELEISVKPFDLLEKDEFAKFLNNKSKRIKKYTKINSHIILEDENEDSRTIINSVNNNLLLVHCACHEAYDTNQMIKFENCKQWYHINCLYPGEQKVKSENLKNCFGCDFINSNLR